MPSPRHSLGLFPPHLPHRLRRNSPQPNSTPRQQHPSQRSSSTSAPEPHGPTAGIHVATWNPSNGTLANLRLAMQADNAAFLATSKRYLFAGHQLPAKMGALSAYQIGPTGDLQLINTINVPEFDFVHTAVDHTGQALITASYGSGKVLSAKIAPDGHLSAPVSQFQLTGHGPNASRQASPHAHGVAIAPDNRFVLINDLGTDRIMIYKLNAATAELTPNNPPYFETAPGSGPRHTAFHPSGKWAYSINELDSTITQMGWNAATGVLTLASNTPTMPPGSDVTAGRAGEVVFDKTGRFLYACNRAAIDDIVVYSVGNRWTTHPRPTPQLRGQGSTSLRHLTRRHLLHPRRTVQRQGSRPQPQPHHRHPQTKRKRIPSAEPILHPLHLSQRKIFKRPSSSAPR